MHRTARWDAQDSAWGAGSLCIRVFYEGKKENVISLAELPGANSYLRSMLRAFSDSARVGRTPGLSQARECWILALHFDRSLSQCSECVLSVRFRVICVQEGFKQAQYRPRVRCYRTWKSANNGVRKRCPPVRLPSFCALRSTTPASSIHSAACRGETLWNSNHDPVQLIFFGITGD